MENKQTKSKKIKAIVTRKSINNTVNEYQILVKEFRKSYKKDWDNNLFIKINKMANKILKDLRELHNDSLNNHNASEVEREKNKKFLDQAYM